MVNNKADEQITEHPFKEQWLFRNQSKFVLNIHCNVYVALIWIIPSNNSKTPIRIHAAYPTRIIVQQ